MHVNREWPFAASIFVSEHLLRSCTEAWTSLDFQTVLPWQKVLLVVKSFDIMSAKFMDILVRRQEAILLILASLPVAHFTLCRLWLNEIATVRKVFLSPSLMFIPNCLCNKKSNTVYKKLHFCFNFVCKLFLLAWDVWRAWSCFIRDVPIVAGLR